MASILAEVGSNPNAVIEWLWDHVGKKYPIGTVLPRYSAVKRWLITQGYDEDAVDAVLPPISGKKNERREGLSPKMLKLYCAEAEKLRDPMRTLLLLLPLTGLRVSEACSLKLTDVVYRGEYRGLHVREGKGGKDRFIPFDDEAEELINGYLEQFDPQAPWLFPGASGDHLKRSAVNMACYKLRSRAPKLGKLSPHILRHTFGQRSRDPNYGNVRPLEVVQRVMGHSDLRTTLEYAKPTDATTGAAMRGKSKSER